MKKTFLSSKAIKFLKIEILYINIERRYLLSQIFSGLYFTFYTNINLFMRCITFLTILSVLIIFEA